MLRIRICLQAMSRPRVHGSSMRIGRGAAFLSNDARRFEVVDFDGLEVLRGYVRRDMQSVQPSPLRVMQSERIELSRTELQQERRRGSKSGFASTVFQRQFVSVRTSLSISANRIGRDDRDNH